MGCGASAQVEPNKRLFAYRVKVIGGLNLYNNSFGVQIPGTKTSAFNFEGRSDPYVVLESHGVKFQTRTILHEQNPVWNEEFIFAVDTTTPWLTLRVFDADLGKDDNIGTAQVDLHGLLGREERELWLELKGSKSYGEIGITVQECYRMWVTAVQGVDVEVMDKLSQSSDAYLTVQVGQQEMKKTKVKGWSLNPVWNERFMFYAPYGSPSQLSLILWDKDSIHPDMNMGWQHVKISGKPEVGPRNLSLPLINAKGRLDIIIEDDPTIDPSIAPAPPVTEEKKKNFPPSAPQSCTFTCRVVGAFNLAASDHSWVEEVISEAGAEIFREYRENKGTSDPFARVTCEGQTYDTHHINNTLEPQWNSKFRFVARNREKSELAIQLFDHDIVVNESIGAVKIPLMMIKPGEKTELWSFLDKGRGEVGVEVNAFFQLKVRVVSAEGLPAKDLNGMSDPYVKVTLADVTHKTRVVRDNRSPWFEEDFRWAIATLKHQKLTVQVWDSDLMILKKGIAEELLGEGEVPLENLKRGIPNQVVLPLRVGGKASGTITLIITDEIPIPPTALEVLKQKGKEAYEAAINKVNATATNFFKVITEADYDRKVEAVIEPFDPKVAPRPRYSRIKAEVLGIRGLTNAVAPIYVGASVPSQGQRYKTREIDNAENPMFNETFEFRLPTKTTTALELTVFESSKHPYVNFWSTSHNSRAVQLFRNLNGGQGLIRGSPADDTWLPLSNGAQIVFRVTEYFRFYLRVTSARGLSLKANPYVVIKTQTAMLRTQSVSHDPAKDRTEGVAGAPVWDEGFTFFTTQKGTVMLYLMDDTLGPDQFLATTGLELSKLRRGVPLTTTLKFDKGGELDITILEEEKMGLADQIVDAAANAAKLVSGAASEVVGMAKAQIGAQLGKLGGAVGGLFS